MRDVDAQQGAQDQEINFIDSPPCSCSTCQQMCNRPCWPVPQEISALIEAGFGHNLMLDWWCGDFHDGEHDEVYIVCPANPGRESSLASSSIYSLQDGCRFFHNGLCSLHTLGLKPTEGRVAHHDMTGNSLHQSIAETWDTDQGREVVDMWCSKFGVDNPYSDR